MPGANRRKEARTKTQASVELLIEDSPPSVVRGLLMDVSASGFRAVHQCPSLSSGQDVQFHHQFACGKARVMWSRVVPGRVESGFLVTLASKRSQTKQGDRQSPSGGSTR
jgi:hypothetical protein